ncbi:uncharacterized protein FOMMEDRAFT_26992 [Fomitiporia mediterranea MF3/22]|uniref:uncharacterized protein n=1 Tax=Fomitiporia mediterranea (strain MF3/22) TaxID=694068 RepID=UPI0004408CB7|nr:uncharacterized protein FOMMEDRAFT_26992 [Fomitiporia mediterranea MF3/22]EJD06275.1 hypothetical protein FOMMEDRAFT_26992 [Fomitiporia mediterranea MF3/22]
MGRQGTQEGNKIHTAQCEQKRVVTHAQAAIRIQRFYRAHRAITALNRLEQRIKTVLNETHDPQAARTQLRGRAAELGSLRAFLNATPHVTSDPRVVNRMRRVEGTLQKLLDKATCAEREREEKRSGSREFIHHAAGVSSSGRRSSRSGSQSSATTRSGQAKDASRQNHTVIRHETKGSTHSDVITKIRPSPSFVVPIPSQNPSNSFILSGPKELSSSPPEQTSKSRRTTLPTSPPTSTTHQQWITRIFAATPPRSVHHQSTVSKAPSLFTIPEASEVLIS